MIKFSTAMKNSDVQEYARAIYLEMEHYGSDDYLEVLTHYARKYALSDVNQQLITVCYASVYQGT
jgi:hypothetical protein